MKVLLVGSGAREHAMAESISRNAIVYSFLDKNNPGIIGLSRESFVSNTFGFRDILKFGRKNAVDIAIVGPEKPLMNGLVDYLERNGIACASPRRNVARIEWSKAFARELMLKNSIPGTPDFLVVDKKMVGLESFLEEHNNEVVVKPDYLTGGKGVKVWGAHLNSHEEIVNYVTECLRNGLVVVEEKLTPKEGLPNAEFTVQAFVTGSHVGFTPFVQDFKRAYDHDTGPNTGSMGSYSTANGSLPFLSENDFKAAQSIVQKTVTALKSYRGVLYGQFMLTDKGVYVVEFNSRFGDPEALNVLPRLNRSLAEISEGLVDGGIPPFGFNNLANVCIYLTPKGYPDKPVRGSIVKINQACINMADGKAYFASVNQRDNTIRTTTSRSVALFGVGRSVPEAREKAYSLLRCVNGDFHYRTDIAGDEYVQS